MFRDVTEQSIIKKKLNESEGLLKGILENTSMIVYIKDLAGRYLFINLQKKKKKLEKEIEDNIKEQADQQKELEKQRQVLSTLKGTNG